MSKNKCARSSLILTYGRVCMLCCKRFKKKKGVLTFHHIKPLSEGGETTPENGALLCTECHEHLSRQDEETKKRLNARILFYKQHN